MKEEKVAQMQLIKSSKIVINNLFGNYLHIWWLDVHQKW
jgi:hypothetical protein